MEFTINFKIRNDITWEKVGTDICTELKLDKEVVKALRTENVTNKEYSSSIDVGLAKQCLGFAKRNEVTVAIDVVDFVAISQLRLIHDSEEQYDTSEYYIERYVPFAAAVAYYNKEAETETEKEKEA